MQLHRGGQFYLAPPEGDAAHVDVGQRVAVLPGLHQVLGRNQLHQRQVPHVLPRQLDKQPAEESSQLVGLPG